MERRRQRGGEKTHARSAESRRAIRRARHREKGGGGDALKERGRVNDRGTESVTRGERDTEGR